MDIPTAPAFEPDFEITTPHWTFDDGVFISGNIKVRMIDATDELVNSCPDAIEWLEQPF